jgi:hypothetical protein
MKFKYIFLVGCILLLLGFPVSGFTNQELFESQTGSVEFIISCGTNALDTVVFVKPDDKEYSSWDGYPVVVNTRIPNERFLPGKYVATLYGGNANKPEVRYFNVDLSGVTRVSFVGKSKTSNFRPVCFEISKDIRYEISKDFSWKNGMWVLTINQNTESRTVTIVTTTNYENIPSETRKYFVEAKPGYGTYWIDIPTLDVPVGYNVIASDPCGDNPGLTRPLTTDWSGK